MPTCSFCKKNFLEPRGLTVFTFEGKSLHFCSSKCRRNLDLGRDAKKVNWVKRDKKVKVVGGNVEDVVEKKVEEIKEVVEKKVGEKVDKVVDTKVDSKK